MSGYTQARHYVRFAVRGSPIGYQHAGIVTGSENFIAGEGASIMLWLLRMGPNGWEEVMIWVGDTTGTETPHTWSDAGEFEPGDYLLHLIFGSGSETHTGFRSVGEPYERMSLNSGEFSMTFELGTGAAMAARAATTAAR